jgi:dienelactone hydrolase
MFDYDRETPLELDITRTEERGEVDLHDLSYASPRGGRVPAYLLVPRGTGPFAGLLFMHPGGADRNAFLDEALTLALAGAVALLIDGPEVRPPTRPLIAFSAEDREVFVQAVVDLRRGVDLLTAREDVDPARLGYVGFSYGATLGAMLAAVEERVTAYVIIGGSGWLTTFLRRMSDDPPSAEVERYLQLMAAVDPIEHVRSAAPAALFFQNGRQDQGTPQEEAAALHEAASEPKLVRWYDGGHDPGPQARRERAEWLGERVGLHLTPAVLERLEGESAA